MINNYLMTKRLENVIEDSNDLSFDELDESGNRYKVILYLAEVYKRSSNVPLTALDHKNIYNIFFVICLPDFGKSLQPQRVALAKEYLNMVKSSKEDLSALIDELLFISHIK
jgi:hypothetical protein